MRDFREDDGRPRILLAGLPTDALALIGSVATEASLIEEVVERGLLSLSGLPGERARAIFGEIGFSRKWERCSQLAREAEGPEAEFLRHWLPKAREVMHLRNRMVHSYWYRTLGDELFYAYGSPLRGKSRLATRGDFQTVLTRVRSVRSEGTRLILWHRGVLASDELLPSETGSHPITPTADGC